MNVEARPILMLTFLLAVGCAAPDNAGHADTTWVGTITTEGNVTTVINESGSVWGGTATLVEEASIGVEAGADEYMFGHINSVYATDDRIYTADVQAPAVRVYDHSGTFIRSIGRPGQGPGEYQYPAIVTADTTRRVFVLASRLARLNVYADSGEVLDSWPFPNSRCCAWSIYPLDRDAIWAPVQEWLDTERSGRRYGVQAVGPDGPVGDVKWIPEIPYERTTFTFDGRHEEVMPFSARLMWNPAPDGRLVVGGSDRYHFEVHGPEGQKLLVERYWEPTPVAAEHKEWERRRTIARMRIILGTDVVLAGSEIPDHKPAYADLIPTLSGETWVARQGISERLTDCAEDPLEAGAQAAFERPCWTDRQVVDVFSDDGRYLGDLGLPPGMQLSRLHTFVDGRLVVSVVQGANGTIMVKRYRLVLPGEE